ncbi:hypothetical protein LOTGIDRAFT_208014 [Lottia gigantea]|uniref:Probable G-protein coupled receptor 19 n=1 Tax=Lottia gigantea TaxID=225164 RepID=V4BBT0_LOTGI|nr:hypothetical protein LOTGIDRAFT_208014 [Lottia gigantea]ESP05061.1 hypothetical protein LOTGIDRAFT_208014 [Lottia gigantea]
MSEIPNTTSTTPVYKPDQSVIGLDQDRLVGQIVLEIITLVILWILAVLGNILVCVVIHRSRRMQSTTNYFIVSLACADLTAVVICVPLVASRITTNKWVVGPLLCKFVRFIQYLVPCANIFVMVSICIDRFYTIIYPLSFKVTRGTAKKLIAFSWAFAAILCCLNFYFFEVTDSPSRSNTKVCPTYIPVSEWPGIVYTLCIVICQFVIPLLIMVIGYTRVFKHIWRTEIGPRPVQRTTNPVPRTKVKMVKMLIIVSYTSVLSYLPFYIVQLWFCFDQNAFTDPTIFVFVALLVLSNGVSKPLIYLCYNSNFRRGCKEVFCMSTMNCYRSNRYAITNASSLGKKNHVGIMEPIGISEMTTVPQSPSRAFNRAQQVEKSVWPLSGTPISNYM